PILRVHYKVEQIDLKKYMEVEELCRSFVDEVVHTIVSFHYKIIGFTIRMGQTNCSIAIINGIKKISPEVITITGGANCSGEMAEGVASLSDSIDYVFSGECENSFNDFLDNYSGRQLPAERIITGILVENLDTLPQLNYEVYFNQIGYYFDGHAPGAAYVWSETSRGCWWGQKKKCTFCSRNTAGIKFRQKTPQKVLEELRHFKENYPETAVAMADNLMPFSYNKELLPILGENNDYPGICLYYIKPNLKLKDLINLKKAKVQQIVPGIEALSTGLLKLINKGITAAENLEFLRNARAVGINLLWFMLWGIPGDKAEYYKEILKVLPLIRHFQPPAKFFRVHLERFSDYYENPIGYHIENLRPWAVYKMIYPEWADIDKLAFEFVGEYPCEAYEHPELIQNIADELEYWRQTWKNSNLIMIPFSDYFIIHDSRNIPGTNQSHILDVSQAKEIMTYGIYEESENQKWAVEEKLAVVVDSRYVPLVTASPELLLKFES
ncbi:MAG: RiPP maturation radical SAM C-methyltransferase, partial [Candidatus Aminicenantes bacterium]|nr:RiPP maturation radical SAM C-methyltransferase [Candidatus Aminicenantes bacterium]